MRNSIIDWLLEKNDPSVRYRTLTDLLDYPKNDPIVKEARKNVYESETVARIIDKMHPDGYWLQKNSRSGVIYGDGVEYGAFATTHFILSYLSEIGITKDFPEVDKAAKRYMSLINEEGDWYSNYSCLDGYNIRTFIRLGYRKDPRIKKAIKYILKTVRFDGGYLCDIHEGKYKTKRVKSCIRGSDKVLMAFAELKELWMHPRCLELVEYFLKREGIFRSFNHEEFAQKDMTVLSYPIVWRANTWEVLLALSKMGYGKDKRLKKAWNYLESRADNDGRYILDWNPVQSPWNVGRRGEPNKWITFYVNLALKYQQQLQYSEQIIS